MKNHKFLILMLFFCIVLLSSCSSSSKKVDVENAEVIEETQYYKILHSGFMFYYYIYDKNHEVVKCEGPINKQPKISVVNDNIVKFTI